jgi:adenylyltransferase/sulfurtransferase
LKNNKNYKMSEVKEITVQELKKMRDEVTPHQLIDVREEHEADIATINGALIPMGEIMDRIDEIKKDIPVIVHCRSGARSRAIVEAIQANFGYTNLYNLKGGILAWAKEIDNTVQTY